MDADTGHALLGGLIAGAVGAFAATIVVLRVVTRSPAWHQRAAAQRLELFQVHQMLNITIRGFAGIHHVQRGAVRQSQGAAVAGLTTQSPTSLPCARI